MKQILSQPFFLVIHIVSSFFFEERRLISIWKLYGSTGCILLCTDSSLITTNKMDGSHLSGNMNNLCFLSLPFTWSQRIGCLLHVFRCYLACSGLRLLLYTAVPFLPERGEGLIPTCTINERAMAKRFGHFSNILCGFSCLCALPYYWSHQHPYCKTYLKFCK